MRTLKVNTSPPTSQTGQTDRLDRQDRQRSDSVGRTVLQTVAQKFAIDFTYDMQKLLLTVHTLVSPLIVTLVTININQMWTHFD